MSGPPAKGPYDPDRIRQRVEAATRQRPSEPHQPAWNECPDCGPAQEAHTHDWLSGNHAFQCVCGAWENLVGCECHP